MSPSLALLSILFALLLFCGAPMVAVLAVPSAIYVLLQDWPSTLIVQRMFAGMTQSLLLALPLFMLAGELMNAGGLMQRLVDFSHALIGRLRGSLALVNLATNMLMAGISGSALADASAVGSLLIPKMVERGYTRAFSAAITAAGSIVGPIIPPSVVFILYSVLAQVSVIDLFLAGVVPGVLIIAMQMVLVRMLADRYGFPPGEPTSLRGGIRSTWRALPVLVLPVIIVGGIRVGVFTPIEGAAIAVAYAVMTGMALRTLSVRDVYRSAVQVGRFVGEILLLVASASLLSYILVAEQVPQAIASAILAITDNRVLVLLIVNVVLLIVGMFLDGFAALIIFVPILLPLAEKLSVDPIHFGLIVSVNIMIGIITPPVGLALFLTSKIANVPFAQAARASIPFLAVSILALLLITFIPEISLTLPRMFK